MKKIPYLVITSIVLFLLVSCSSLNDFSTMRQYQCEPFTKTIDVRSEINKGDILRWDEEYTSVQCFSPNESPSKWSDVLFFMDSYEHQTDKKYIKQIVDNGKFSNSATTDSSLSGFILFSEDLKYHVFLYEYDYYPVKSLLSDSDWKVGIYDKENVYYETECTLTDRFIIEIPFQVLKRIALIDGDLSFRIQSTKYHSTYYVFSIDNMNFNCKVYDILPAHMQNETIDVLVSTTPVYADRDETIIIEDTISARRLGKVSYSELTAHPFFIGKNKKIENETSAIYDRVLSELTEKAVDKYGAGAFVSSIEEKITWSELSLLFYFDMFGYVAKTTWTGDVYAY